MSPARSPRGSVVLLSGGMDSATCLALASRASRPVHALTVAYGQRHLREIRSARALARHFGVRHHVVVDLPLGPLLESSLTRPRRALPRGRSRTTTIPSTYVPARNTILLSVALGYAESHHLNEIYLGANAIDYSGYPTAVPPSCGPSNAWLASGLDRGSKATGSGCEPPFYDDPRRRSSDGASA